MTASLQRIVFPNHDKSNSKIETRFLTEEERVKYGVVSKKPDVLVQCLSKITYENKLKDYRNEKYQIEEVVIDVSSSKKMYKAKIWKVGRDEPIFNSLLDDLKNSTSETRSISVTIRLSSIEKLDHIAKLLKVSRSSVIQRILDESLAEIFK